MIRGANFKARAHNDRSTAELRGLRGRPAHKLASTPRERGEQCERNSLSNSPHAAIVANAICSLRIALYFISLRLGVG